MQGDFVFAGVGVTSEGGHVNVGELAHHVGVDVIQIHHKIQYVFPQVPQEFVVADLSHIIQVELAKRHQKSVSLQPWKYIMMHK